MKWRLFRQFLNGDDPHAERVYRWHVIKRSGHRMEYGVATDGWKQSTDDYMRSARDLFESMQANGYDSICPIPVDPNGELLGGAHRTACALALGLESVTVEYRPTVAWAPPWGLRWFVENNMPFADLSRLNSDFKDLMELRK